MIVVSNSGPIIALSRIKRLNLLKHYYNKIYVSKATYNELLSKGKEKAGYEELKEAVWIEPKDVKDRRSVSILELELEIGEAETIILAHEIKADLVLMDEYIAREIAKSLNLKVSGSIGILIKAKKDRLIEKLKPVLDMLKKKNIWISKELYNEALKLANEI